MKIFIFGAGASRGSQQPGMILKPNSSSVSPLVNELFLSVYRGCNRTNPDDPGSKQFLSWDEWNECVTNTEKQASLEKWLTQRWLEIEAKKEAANRHAEQAFFARVTFYVW